MKSGWNVETLQEHLTVVRDLEARIQKQNADALTLARTLEEKFNEERDRRYTEVAQEKDKALKIKEQGDRDALVLAREIQTYKDEKANELRSQIERERGNYATKDDIGSLGKELRAELAPLKEYRSSQTGRGIGQSALWGYILGLIGILVLLYSTFKPAPPTPVQSVPQQQITQPATR